MQIVQGASAEQLTEASGFDEKREGTLAQSTQLNALVIARRQAKQDEVHYPEERNIEVRRLSRQSKKYKQQSIQKLTEKRIEGL
eukprot:926225-Pyramimonas_sp.AAC.1